MKIVSKLFLSIFLLVSSASFYGCDDFCDGSKEEPLVTITYNRGGSVTSVYASKDGKDLDILEGATGTSFSVPVDLNATSVVYNIRATDTNGPKILEIRYTPVSKLQDHGCGFRFYIENVTIGPKTDYTNVSDPTSDSDSNFQISIQ